MEKSPVEECNFGGIRKIERRDAAHVVAVNMDDIEVALDLLDNRTEQARMGIDVMKLDRHCGDVS